MGRIQSLQMLRFFAALAVVWHHACINFGGPHTHGAAGVDIFFVLSGAVIGRAAQTRPDGFLSDRLTRIFPIYWVLAAPWALMAIMAGGWEPGRMFTTATLVPLFDQRSYLGPAWTLCFELVFYLAMALALRGVRPWLIGGAFVLCAAANILVDTPLVRTLGSPLVAEFAMGLVASRIKPPASWLGWISVGLGAAIILLTPLGLGNPADTYRPAAQLVRVFLWGLPALLIVSGAMAVNCDGPPWKPLLLLGDASYSLYLSHYLVLLVLIDVVGRSVPPLLAAALCVGVSVPLHLWVERPLLRWSRTALRPRALAAMPAE